MRLAWILAAGVAAVAYSPPARRSYLTWGVPLRTS
jgi:hypothetical protein